MQFTHSRSVYDDRRLIRGISPLPIYITVPGHILLEMHLVTFDEPIRRFDEEFLARLAATE